MLRTQVARRGPVRVVEVEERRWSRSASTRTRPPTPPSRVDASGATLGELRVLADASMLGAAAAVGGGLAGARLGHRRRRRARAPARAAARRRRRNRHRRPVRAVGARPGAGARARPQDRRHRRRAASPSSRCTIRDLLAVAADDHTAVLRLLSDRRDELTGERRRTINRLHRLRRDLHPGGAPRQLSADRGRAPAHRDSADGAVDQPSARRSPAQLVADVRRIDRALLENRRRCAAGRRRAGSTLTEIFGISDVLAAKILGHTGDITRFASADHYASYTGTAPVEASSGEQTRHRLSRAGNRSLNHALHMAARVQTMHPGPGRIALPAQTRRTQDTDRSAPQPQAPARQGRLPPTARRPAPLSDIVLISDLT